MENTKELSLNELENVTGGKNNGGYDRRPQEKPGCVIYKIDKPVPGGTGGTNTDNNQAEHK